jgi:hypothetical protein
MTTDNEPTSEIQAPLQQVIVIASIVCFVSWFTFYWFARPLMELLEVRWMEWMVYACIPVTVTFIYLHRSGWHLEITGVARTWSLLLLSCLIFGGEMIAAPILICLAAFCVNATTGGNH